MAEKTFSPVRVRAATQEAAIAQALQMTGASREEIEIEVLEETEKGVTIRIAPQGTLSAKAETAPADEPQAEEAQAQSTPVAVGEEAEPEVEEEAVGETDAAPVAEERAVEETVSEESADEDEAPSTPEAAAPGGFEDDAPEIREADPEVVEHARSLAQEMLDHMGLEAQAVAGDLPIWCLPTSHDKSERVRDVPRAFLSIEGEDVGILIGKHGQTLQSFQYLLNLSLNNTAEDQEATSEGVREGGVHVVVDAGEYRGRRAVALERAAREAAERAKRDRRSVRMEPMPGHERRLVHLALFGDKEISTSSEGREPWRRVVVHPAGARPSRGGEENGGRGKRQGGERYSERSGGYGSARGGHRGSERGSGHRSYGSSAGNGRRSYN